MAHSSKEYQRNYMRKYQEQHPGKIAEHTRKSRAKQKEEHQKTLETIKAFPEFQQLPKEKQDKIEASILHILAALDSQIDAKMEEAEQYSKLKIEEIYQRKLKAVLDLSIATHDKAEELKEFLK
jgi:esterase/lipase